MIFHVLNALDGPAMQFGLKTCKMECFINIWFLFIRLVLPRQAKVKPDWKGAFYNPVSVAGKWILHRPSPYLSHIWPLSPQPGPALERHKSVAGWLAVLWTGIQTNIWPGIAEGLIIPASFQLLGWKTCVNIGRGGGGDIRIVLPRINRFPPHILAPSNLLYPRNKFHFAKAGRRPAQNGEIRSALHHSECI